MDSNKDLELLILAGKILKSYRATSLPISELAKDMGIGQQHLREAAASYIRNEIVLFNEELGDQILLGNSIEKSTDHLTRAMKRVKREWRDTKWVVKPFARLAPSEIDNLNRNFAKVYVTAARHRFFQQRYEAVRHKKWTL